MSDEYPRDSELETIKNWDLLTTPVAELVDYVEHLWHWPERGFKLSGVRVLRLELHTGGWSGNESIIGALKDNPIFWVVCWMKSTRGGHYWFKIDTTVLTTKGKGRGKGI